MYLRKLFLIILLCFSLLNTYSVSSRPLKYKWEGFVVALGQNVSIGPFTVCFEYASEVHLIFYFYIPREKYPRQEILWPGQNGTSKTLFYEGKVAVVLIKWRNYDYSKKIMKLEVYTNFLLEKRASMEIVGPIFRGEGKIEIPIIIRNEGYGGLPADLRWDSTPLKGDVNLLPATGNLKVYLKEGEEQKINWSARLDGFGEINLTFHLTWEDEWVVVEEGEYLVYKSVSPFEEKKSISVLVLSIKRKRSGGEKNEGIFPPADIPMGADIEILLIVFAIMLLYFMLVLRRQVRWYRF